METAGRLAAVPCFRLSGASGGMRIVAAMAIMLVLILYKTQTTWPGLVIVLWVFRYTWCGLAALAEVTSRAVPAAILLLFLGGIQ